jgi:mannitol-1-phosphate 5-dehydrogenase
VKAVIIGPGREGCGFVGPALRARGYELVFVGRDPTVVSNLDALGSYRVELAHGDSREQLVVDRVRALLASDRDGVADAIAEADLVATAVGAHQLETVAPLIAAGLSRRTTPVNVWCCENLDDAGARLRALVAEHLTAEADLRAHGFAGVLVTRAITQRVGDPCDGRPLMFVGDPSKGFLVERPGLVGPIRRMPGMSLVDDYTAAVQAKLCIFSAGHASAAYLGHLKGHRHIHTAMRDPEIRAVVMGAMDEGRRGILARYGSGYARRPGALRAIATRFENAELADPVSRVGRDPLRKLAAGDRLIGAAKLAHEAGVAPVNLCTAAAAAMWFDAHGDGSAATLQAQIGRDGPRRALARVAGLPEHDPLVDRTVGRWQALAGGASAATP